MLHPIRKFLKAGDNTDPPKSQQRAITPRLLRAMFKRARGNGMATRFARNPSTEADGGSDNGHCHHGLLLRDEIVRDNDYTQTGKGQRSYD
jgi:hypothetical protein